MLIVWEPLLDLDSGCSEVRPSQNAHNIGPSLSVPLPMRSQPVATSYIRLPKVITRFNTVCKE